MRLALAVLALLLVAAPAEAKLDFAMTCGGNFECAKLTVPLDRSGKVPGKIELSIERRAAEGKSAGAVFALAGGPGQGASSVTEGFATDTFGAIGARDLIVVDQRGTGRSGALNCPELERPGDAPADVRTAKCADRLGAKRSFFTTEDTVQDLEAVRAGLGIDRITLFGVSYGTKVALVYAARYPEHVERLVLDSVVPPEGQSPFDLDSFAAIPRILTEMCRDECAGITDDLAADVAELADRIGTDPLRGPVIDPRGRRRVREVTARDLYQRIRAGDGAAEFRVEYPGAVRAALDGDPAPLIRLEHGGRLGSSRTAQSAQASQVETLSFTLQAATLCEEAPLPWDRFASPEERDAQARANADSLPDSAFEPFDRPTALAPDANNLIFQCRRWPVAPLRFGPVTLDDMPDVPTLVLEGLEDIRTPLEIGQRVAAAFPRAQLLAAPKTGHAVLAGAVCARTALKRFFADQPLGDPCAAARRSVRIRPVPPASLDAIAGASKAARTLAAVALTLKDLRSLSGFGTARGGGLRAGRYRKRGDDILLKGFSYVPGVEIAGRVAALGARSGTLTVRGDAAAKGVLKLRKGRLTGRLGGRPVSGP